MLLSTCKLVLSLENVDDKTKDKIKGRIEKAKMAMQKQEERYKKMCQEGFQNIQFKNLGGGWNSGLRHYLENLIQRMAGVTPQKSNPIESQVQG